MAISPGGQVWIVFTTVTLAIIVFLSRKTRFLSIGPFVASGDDFIVAKTGRLAQILTMGISSRFVLVDRAKKIIRVRSRSFWFFKKAQTFRFARVRQVLYGYSDLNPVTGLGLTGDSFEVFSVGLRMIDDEVVRLFRFVGEGTFRCGWDVPGPLERFYFWDRWTDLSGTQEEDSRAFLDRLAGMLNVEIGAW